jgi:hypothetical protein
MSAGEWNSPTGVVSMTSRKIPVLLLLAIASFQNQPISQQGVREVMIVMIVLILDHDISYQRPQGRDVGKILVIPDSESSNP